MSGCVVGTLAGKGAAGGAIPAEASVIRDVREDVRRSRAKHGHNLAIGDGDRLAVNRFHARSAEGHVILELNRAVAAAGVEFDRARSALIFAPSTTSVPLAPRAPTLTTSPCKVAPVNVTLTAVAGIVNINQAAISRGRPGHLDLPARGRNLDRSARTGSGIAQQREQLRRALNVDCSAIGFPAVENNVAALAAGAAWSRLGNLDPIL